MSNTTSIARKVLSAGITILIIASIFALLYPFLTNPTSITKAYDSAGIFAPVIFILLVMIAPTPGAVIGASGGAYFGIWLGALYLFIANLLGVCLVFLLVQRYGRPIVQHVAKEEQLARYEKFIIGHPLLQWIVYAIPVFPIELMTFVISLSGKSFRKFFITVVTALPIYALVVTSIGYQVSATNKRVFDYASIFVLAIVLYAVVHFLYVWKNEEIKIAGKKFASDVKSQVEKVGKKTTSKASKPR